MVEVEVVYERAVPPPPPHFHPFQEERYLGLDGEVVLRVDGRERILREGDTLVVPRRAVHQVWAAGPGRPLWQTMPALQTEQLLEAIWSVARDGHVGRNGQPSAIRAAAAVAPFIDEFRLPHVPKVIQRCACGLAAQAVRRVLR